VQTPTLTHNFKDGPPVPTATSQREKSSGQIAHPERVAGVERQALFAPIAAQLSTHIMPPNSSSGTGFRPLGGKNHPRRPHAGTRGPTHAPLLPNPPPPTNYAINIPPESYHAVGGSLSALLRGLEDLLDRRRRKPPTSPLDRCLVTGGCLFLRTRKADDRKLGTPSEDPGKKSARRRRLEGEGPDATGAQIAALQGGPCKRRPQIPTQLARVCMIKSRAPWGASSSDPKGHSTAAKKPIRGHGTVPRKPLSMPLRPHCA
jgi:hypothetical protein